MKRLVLGIIAVVFLQIAFFMYTASDVPADLNARVVRSDPAGPLASVSRRSRPAPPVSRTYSIPDTPSARAMASRVLERPGIPVTPHRKVSERDRNVLRPVEKNRTARVRSTSPTFERVSVRRGAGNLIPKGHTMVLVDNLPIKSSVKTADITRPKKRSYLARALPALVKKPWNWMKSLASKLD